jgi:hypothetical protein
MAWTKRAKWRYRRAEAAFIGVLMLLISGFGLLFLRLPEVTQLAQRLLA